LVLYNKLIQNIPVVNSTNTNKFLTGILWDTSDGNVEYNGTQDIVFVTQKNQTWEGKYGSYEYELRIPATLKNYKHNSGTVSLYIELT
jgi:hypothetical protein